MVHIYNNSLKFLASLNYDYEVFIKEPSKFYPEWQSSFYATQQKYEHPILDAESQSLREMNKYEKFKKGLYELQFNEAEYQGDILTLKEGQYVDEHGVLQTVPKIEGTRVEWNWTTHIWEEKATDLEIVMAQYNEYSSMDTPSTLKEMQTQDPALATELVDMLIELRGMIYSLQAQTKIRGFSQLHIPTPSQNLINFKNKFNLIK